MNASSELEALTIARDRFNEVEKRAAAVAARENDEEGTRRRWDAFVASLGKIIEKQGETQPSDML